MNDLERHEHRYFCDVQDSSTVERILDSLGILARISYALPITETIYFTYGQKAKFETPTGLTVRLRRYAHILSDAMEISKDKVLLEIKRNDQATNLNTKERILVPGVEAVNALAGMEDRLGLRQRLGLPTDRQLLPTGATQSYRCHWIHQSGLRLTFDRDVRFFLFTEDLHNARIATVLGEGKLEFKFPKANGRDENLEKKIVATCGCVKRTHDYLERRAKECIMEFISTGTGR